MKLLLMISAVAALVAGVAGCAGAPTPLPAPDSGAALLYRQKCSACHSAPHPRRHTYAQWLTLVGKMEAHAGGVLLTEAERDEILGYLRTHSRSSKFPWGNRGDEREKAHGWDF